MKESSFTFIGSEQLKNKRDVDLVCSLNAKTGVMFFSPKSYKSEELKGSYLKFYVDTNKGALGWKILNEKGLSGLKEYRRVFTKVLPQTGSVRIRVGVPKQCIDALGLKKSSYKKMSVKKYEPTSLLSREKFYYIILK